MLLKKVFMAVLLVAAFCLGAEATLHAQVTTFPYNETFESQTNGSGSGTTVYTFTNGWTAQTSTMYWQVWNGSTTSTGTGPTTDYNPGTAAGKYVYLETSQGATGNQAVVQSPTFDYSALADPSIQFAYHMLGATMGNMHLDLTEFFNQGTDGANTGTTFSSAGATFAAAHVGSTIVITGGANAGSYTIASFVNATTVTLGTAPSANLTGMTYQHVLVTQDVISPWTDDLNAWQLKQVPLNSALVGGGTIEHFAFRIRGDRGTSFTGDMAFDDVIVSDGLPPTLAPAGGSSFNASLTVAVTAGAALANADLQANDPDTATIDVTVTAINAAPGVTAPTSQTGVSVPHTMSWTGTPQFAGLYKYSVVLNDGASTVSFTVTIQVNAQFSLATVFNGNTTSSSGGHVFDLTPGASMISVSRFDLKMSATTVQVVDVYYKAGTHAGFETNPAAWTLWETVTTTGQGTALPTPVNLSFPLVLQPATTYGVAVICRTVSTIFTAYTPPKTYNDANLTITQGRFVLTGFTASIANYEWNGAVHYDLGGNPPPTLAPAGGSKFDISLTGVVPVNVALANAELVADDFNNSTVNITVTAVNAIPGVTAPANQTGASVPFTLTWTGTPGGALGNYVYNVVVDDGTWAKSFTVTFVVDDPSISLGNVAAITNSFPFNFTTPSGRFQTAYGASELNLAAGTIIKEIRVGGSVVTPLPLYQNLRLRVAYTTLGVNSLTSTFANNFTAGTLTTVLGPIDYTPQVLAGGIGYQWYVFPLSVPIVYNGTGTLLLDWSYDNRIGNGFAVSTTVPSGETARARVYSNGGNSLTTTGTLGTSAGNYAIRFVTAAVDGVGLSGPAASGGMVSPFTDKVIVESHAIAATTSRTLDSVTFTKTGTITDAQISNVKLVRDDNNNGVVDTATDTVLGSGTLTAGSITFSGSPLLNITAGTPVRLLLAMTVPAALTPGTTVQFQIVDSSDLTFSGGIDTTRYPFGSGVITERMIGTYTIANGNPGGAFDFADIGAAFTALEAGGIAGPVVLELYDDGGAFNSTAAYQLGADAGTLMPVLGLSAANTLTIRAATGETPVLQGNGARTRFSTTGTGTLAFENMSYLTLEGLTITGGAHFGVGFYYSAAGGTANNIRRCKIHGVSLGAGIFVWGNGVSSITNFTIENNMLWNCGGDGGTALGSYVKGVVVSAQVGSGWIVRHNTIVHSPTSADSSAYYVAINTAIWSQFNYNVTHFSPSTALAYFRLANTTNTNLPTTVNRNVVFLGGTATMCNNPNFDTWAEWQLANKDVNGLNTDPLLVSTADLHLQPGSPAIDLAVGSPVTIDIDGNTRPTGSAPDAGAHESQVGANPDLVVQRGSTTIPVSGTDALGNVYTMGQSFTWTIQNTGNVPVNITVPISTTPGTGTPGVSVTTQPAATVAVGGSTSFTILVTPAAGAFNFAVSISNSVAAKNPYSFTVTGTGVTPEMDVLRGATPVADGGTDALGNVATTGASFTWTVNNTGTGDLLITTPITVTPGTGAPGVSVTTQPSNTVAAGSGTTTFVVQVTPSVGAFTFTISITNNDPNENPYNFTVTGTGTGPEMDVLRGSAVADGGTDALGNVPVAGQTFTWTIQNNGNASLSITTPITVTPGTGTPGVSVTSQPATSVAASGSTTFQILVTPPGGAFTFTVSITNNDANENPYNFTVTGTGTAAEIDIQRSSTSIASGGTDPLGNVQTAGQSFTWTILNTGNIALSVTTPITTTPGTGAPTVNVTAQPATSVAASGSTTFTIQVIPSTGAFTFGVSITNSDANENPYTFTVTGTGIDPEIDILRSATPVADGGTDSLGNVSVSGQSFTWTIENNGNVGDLVITVPISTAPGTGSPTVSVTAQPAATVAPAGSTTFTILVTPASGAFTFTVTITNNDANEGTYDFTVSGTGVSPEIDLQRTGSIADGGTDSLGNVSSAGQSFTWTIQNTGPVDLLVTTPITVTPGTGAPTVSVTTQPANTVATNTTFTILVTPAIGAFTFTISIVNNDLNENPYDFTVQGNGITPNGPAVADPATGSSFAGSTNGPFSQSVNPGATLANASIELTDPEADSITVSSITLVTAAPAGITAPGVPGAGQPITLTWSGTASAANPTGVYTWEVTFQDAVNGTPVTVDVSIVIGNPPPTHVIANASGGDGSAGNPYTAEYTQTMGSADDIDLATVTDPNTGQTLSISGVTPGSNPSGGAGFGFVLVGGFLNVAPGGALTANDVGTHTFAVSVTDGTNFITINVSIVVAAVPVITTASPLPAGEQGQLYTPLTLVATGGTGTLTFVVTAGTFPPGLTLSAAGDITGTPTAQGSYNFTVFATDTNNIAGSKVFDITISPPATGNPTITTTALPDGTVGQSYGPATIVATGGTGVYSFAVSAGLLPPGLTLNPGTGAITGTPTNAAIFNFDVTVTDSAFATDTQSYQIKINGTGGGSNGGKGKSGSSGCVQSQGGSAWLMLAALMPVALLLRRRRARS